MSNGKRITKFKIEKTIKNGKNEYLKKNCGWFSIESD